MEQPEVVNEPRSDAVTPVPVNQFMTQDTPDIFKTEAHDVAQSVSAQKPKAKIGKRVIVALLAVMLVVGVAYGVYYALNATRIASSQDTKASTMSTQQDKNSATSQESDTSTSAIDNDLKSIDSDITASTADQTSADDALRDANNQITVPTE